MEYQRGFRQIRQRLDPQHGPAVYKDLNATVMRNANEIAPTGTVNLGGSTRPELLCQYFYCQPAGL